MWKNIERKREKKLSKKNSRVSTIWFMLEITRWCSVLYAQNNHCLCQKGGKKLKEKEGKSGIKGIWVRVGVGVLKSVCTGDTMARWHSDTTSSLQSHLGWLPTPQGSWEESSPEHGNLVQLPTAKLWAKLISPAPLFLLSLQGSPHPWKEMSHNPD